MAVPPTPSPLVGNASIHRHRDADTTMLSSPVRARSLIALYAGWGGCLLHSLKQHTLPQKQNTDPHSFLRIQFVQLDNSSGDLLTMSPSPCTIIRCSNE